MNSAEKTRVMLASLLVVLLACTRAQAENLTVQWPTGGAMGFGFDARTGSVIPNQCVAISEKNEPLPVTGASVGDGFKFDFARTKSELRRKLSANVEGSYNSGAVRLSARASLARSFAMTQEDIAAVVWQRWTITEQTSQLVGTFYGPGYLEKSRSNPSAFTKECGTHYIGVISKGGEFTAVIHSSTTSETERKSFQAAVAGAGVGKEGKGDIATEMERARLSTRLKIVGSKAGGGDGVPMDLAALKGEFTKFRKEAGSFPVVISAVLFPYPGVEDFSSRVAALDAAAEKAFAYEDKVARLNEVKEQQFSYDLHPDTFDAFANHIDRVAAKAERLWKQRQVCRVAEPANDPEPEACQLLKAIARPPPDRVDKDIPRPFTSSCEPRRVERFEREYTQFAGDSRGVPATGAFRFTASVKPLQDRSALRAKLRIEFDGFYKNDEVDLLRVNGCRIDPSQNLAREISGNERYRFTNQDPNSRQLFAIKGGVLETASCHFEGRKPGCLVRFAPISDVRLLNEELFDAQGNARDKWRFPGSSWLAEK